jgi:hypothetical protein
MNHFTTPEFWQHYNALPQEVQVLADRNYALLKTDPGHRSLKFKNIEGLWSVRVGLHYRALAAMWAYGFYWFWIGPHAVYDTLLRQT